MEDYRDRLVVIVAGYNDERLDLLTPIQVSSLDLLVISIQIIQISLRIDKNQTSLVARWKKVDERLVCYWHKERMNKV